MNSVESTCILYFFSFSGRHKTLVNSHRSSPWLAQLHSEYMSLGLPSPWSPSRSCDINQQDAYGRSALHYATEQGHTYIVHMLIKAGESLNMITYFSVHFHFKIVVVQMTNLFLQLVKPLALQKLYIFVFIVKDDELIKL